MLGPRSLCPTLRLHLSHLGKVRLLGAFMEEGVGGRLWPAFQGLPQVRPARLQEEKSCPAASS